MSTDVEQKRGRGRPVGSTMPVEQKRKRKDYRLSPTALAQIEQWKQEKKETAFIEEAIAYYVAREYHLLEVEHLQARISELETDLRLAQGEVKALKSSKQVVVSPPVVPAAKRRAVSYQIIVKHEGGPCPVLPDGFYYDNTAPYQCPVHQVFSQSGSINTARRALEHLKKVAGLKEMWIAKNGDALEHDRWLKNRDRWEKN